MKSLLMFSILLLGTSWAAAQTPATQPDQSSDMSNQSQMSNTNSGSQSMEGCLSGSDGNYMLTTKDGTTYQLMGDTAKMADHVGHTVKVMGTVSQASASGDSSAMSSGSGKQSIQVTSFKHVSKTCNNGSGGMSK